MARSQESMQKKAVRQKKEKKRKDKEKRRLESKDQDKNSFDDMIAYVDEFGNILDSPPDPSEKEEVELDDIEISVAKSDPNAVVDTLKNGVVSFFDESKGFGFIRNLENDQRIFVHVSSLNEPIKENNMVTFEIGKGPKGPAAMNVSVVR
ncbi:MAG: cold shock domain-containing protein [Bacteroidales bacterium]|jgi:cold shock CspA family protein|nr:cold shock domain-containing protein [Bacteroidales bacterium]HOI32906.1 cold shock domain-containing protein [Bacteroidales bacterium]